MVGTHTYTTQQKRISKVRVLTLYIYGSICIRSLVIQSALRTV